MSASGPPSLRAASTPFASVACSASDGTYCGWCSRAVTSCAAATSLIHRPRSSRGCSDSTNARVASSWSQSIPVVISLSSARVLPWWAPGAHQPGAHQGARPPPGRAPARSDDRQRPLLHLRQRGQSVHVSGGRVATDQAAVVLLDPPTGPGDLALPGAVGVVELEDAERGPAPRGHLLVLLPQPGVLGALALGVG